ncbi:MAG TPA: hypothetical protein VJ576_18810 [Rhodocyclaceae bacterium]|nr:hypothetical protein [Rhodocyclaceae bacterium]
MSQITTRDLLMTALWAVFGIANADSYVPIGAFFGVRWVDPINVNYGEPQRVTFEVTSHISGPNNSTFQFPSQNCQVSGLANVKLSAERLGVALDRLVCAEGGGTKAYPISAYIVGGDGRGDLPGKVENRPNGLPTISIDGRGAGSAVLLKGLPLSL